MDFSAWLVSIKESYHAVISWGSSTQNQLTNLAAIAGIFTVVPLAKHLFQWIYKKWSTRKLTHCLSPYFNEYEIQKATQYFVPTQCQNVDPAQSNEPSRTYALASKEPLIPFFINKVFLHPSSEKFYIVLADSGMGKTTFMINLYLQTIKLRNKELQIILLPLGYPESINQKIQEIKEKEKTILLLDAFDEDVEAVQDYQSRMTEIVQLTKEFRTVVITSRTQFFPSEDRLPNDTGIMRFGGDKGEYCFHRTYVSPFEDRDIKVYLRKKFPFWKFRLKRRAQEIVSHSPNLMARPMLLAKVEDLMSNNQSYEYSYQIYE